MGKRLLVLHGPNLNLLGEREGGQGGRLADLDAALRARAAELRLELEVVQSNHEGVLIDTLHAARSRVEGVVVSPAGLFGSYPLREALEAVGLPALEVYLEELGDRESVVAEACAATLEGQGFDSYLEALERFASDDLTGELTDEEEEGEEKEDASEEAEESEEEVEAGAEDEDDVVEAGWADDEGEEGEEPEGPAKTLGRRKKLIPREKSLAVVPSRALARAADAPAKALARPVGGGSKTLGRKAQAPAASTGPSKTLGRKVKGATPAANFLTRALVRQKIADRLAGRLTPAELATWARSKWTEVQGGAPAERGYKELLEDSLLMLSSLPARKLSDAELVNMMTRLEG